MANLNPNEVSDKSYSALIILNIFFGALGAHRFYAGKIASGILYLLTAGVFGIGSLVDFIVILCDAFKDKNGDLIVPKAAVLRVQVVGESAE